VVSFLTKPVRQSELRKAIQTALGARPEKLSSERRPPPTGARRLRILLAEDNPINQKLATRLLEKQGHAVMVAGGGHEATETWGREPVDLSVMGRQVRG